METKVPFFELKRLYNEQKDELNRAVAHVLESGWYILGREVERFEAAMGEALAGPNMRVVGCNSGTDALVLSLLACGAGVGDEVIVPSHTAIPTITAIRSAGATPVFVDVDSATWVLEASAVKRALTKRTRAVIAVHLYGNMVNVPAVQVVLRETRRQDVAVIEDVAQAQGARLAGREAGTIGRFGAFSFYPSKNIGALGDGGAVFAAAPEDEAALRKLRNYGQRDRYNAEVGRGMNSRLDELQAAILAVRLARLQEWNRRKDAQVNTYREQLGGLPLEFQRVTEGCAPAWHLFVIALESSETRDALAASLQSSGIVTLVHYPHPTHLQKAFKSPETPTLAVTERLAPRILSLPMNAGLRADEQEAVIAAIRRFFAN
jgi:dTDP-3-amino-3,4,6-trideoxy-alpha-D-glucose transaminase